MECLKRVRVFVVVLLALIAAGSSRVALAQDATPAAGAVACDGEQASADELLALWYGPDGTQASPVAGPATATELSIPVGPAADAETAAAVELTVRQVFACFDAGDALRAYALFTDDLVRAFGPEPGTLQEDAVAFLTATPVPGPSGEDGEDSEIVAVTDAMLLGDGRVGAFVIERSGDVVLTSYAVFEQQDGRWLVDEVIEFTSPDDGA